MFFRKRRQPSPQDVALRHCVEGTTPGGLERRYVDEYIGHGLFSSRAWSRGDFLSSYQGLLCTEEEGMGNENEDTYQYYFTFKGKRMCIDGTNSACLARFANDARKGGNAIVKLLETGGRPYLCFFAARDIVCDEEIRYNYGVSSLPWRHIHERNPHRPLISWFNDLQCKVCSTSVSGGWKGLLCLGCEDVWHEKCFVTAEQNPSSCPGIRSYEVADSEGTLPPPDSNPLLERDDEAADSDGTPPPPASNPLLEQEDDEATDSDGTLPPPASNPLLEQEDDEAAASGETTPPPDSNPLLEQEDEAAASGETTPPPDSNPLLEQDDEVTYSDGTPRPPASNPLLEQDDEAADSDEIPPPPASNPLLEQEDDESADADGPPLPPDWRSAVNEDHESADADGPPLPPNWRSAVNEDDDAEEDWPPLPPPSQLVITDVLGGDEDVEDWLPLPPPPPELALDSSADIGSDEDGDDWHPLPPPPPELALDSSADTGMHSGCLPPPSTVLHEKEKGFSSDSCTAFPGVTVPQYKKQNGSRSYSKTQSCYVCGRVVMNKMTRHLRIHEDDPAVAEVFALSDPEARKRKLEGLRLMGNFDYNIRVLKKGSGELIVVRRSRQEKVVEDYLPCISCYGFYEVTELWRHYAHCKVIQAGGSTRDEDEESKEACLTTKCRMLLNGALGGRESLFLSDNFPELRTEVLRNMREDEVKKAVEGDELTLMFGATLLQKLGKLRRHVISQRMRQLARLVMEYSDKFERRTLMELIDPSCFDDVVTCVGHLCGDSRQRTVVGVRMFIAPSYGLHIGHALVKCTMLKRGRAIRLKDKDMREDAVLFEELLQGQEWQAKISSPALQTLKERKLNSVELLPSTKDLGLLKDHARQEVERARGELMDGPDEWAWVRLARALFVLLTSFNKRRSGEVARLTVAAYKDRPKWKESRNEEMEAALSPLEKKLANRFDMVQIPGKRGRRVPLLIKSEWTGAMDLLVQNRMECSVTSVFFFGVPGEESHLNAWKVIRDLAVDAGCEHPERISSTRMRKYTATVLQLLNLEEGELEWVSNHLGHNIDIHRMSYRLHEATVECSKVARLLLAVESGTVSRHKGKRLEELEVKDIDFSLDTDGESEEEHEDDEEQPLEVPQPPTQRGNQARIEQNIYSNTFGAAPSASLPQKRRTGNDTEQNVPQVSQSQRKRNRRPWIEDDEDEDDSTYGAAPSASVPQKRRTGNDTEGNVPQVSQSQRKRNRRPWIEDDEDEDDSAAPSASVPQKRRTGNDTEGNVPQGTKPRGPMSEKRKNGDAEESVTQGPRKKKTKRSKWPSEEIELLKVVFRNELQADTLPGFGKIRRMMGKYPFLQKRNPAAIKTRFSYLLKQGKQ